MKKRVLTIAGVLVLAAGVALLLYPYFQSGLYQIKSKKVIEQFKEGVKKEKSLNGKKDYLPELLEVMKAYNKRIYKEKQTGLKDPFSYEQPGISLVDYGIVNNMIGFIEVSALDVTLPIYLGATKGNMALGAVHLSETSFPIGGKNTNTVIAAHRGNGGVPMFRYIEKLKKGDEVKITNFWETLSYEVNEIKIIKPTEIKDVFIQEGKDLITLLSCHPYPENYERYVVYCHRVKK